MGTTLEFEKNLYHRPGSRSIASKRPNTPKMDTPGRITVSRLGNDYRITGSDLEAFLDDTRVN